MPWTWRYSEEHWQVFYAKNVLQSNSYRECRAEERLAGSALQDFTVLVGSVCLQGKDTKAVFPKWIWLQSPSPQPPQSITWQ